MVHHPIVFLQLLFHHLRSMMTMTREKKPTGCSQPSSEPVVCSQSLLLLLASSSPLNYYKRNFLRQHHFFFLQKVFVFRPRINFCTNYLLPSSCDLLRPKNAQTKMFPLSSFLLVVQTRQKSGQTKPTMGTNSNNNNTNNRNSNTFSRKKGLIHGYLLLYNLIQSLGWTAVLASALRAVLLPASSNFGRTTNWQERLTTVYDHSSMFVKPFQILSLMETLHAVFGFVRSPVLPSVLQWMGRTHVLMCVTDSVMPLQKTTAAGVLILCWAITECVRYPCYALGILNATPKWLLYLRYTLFIPLYPLGAASEMKLMYDSIGFVKRVEMYYVHMPNVLNFAFDYSWFLYLVLVVYPFMFAQLYFYMFHQRRRKLKTKKA